jgi:ribonuclease HI
VTLGELAQVLDAGALLAGDAHDAVQTVAPATTIEDAAPAGVAIVETPPAGDVRRPALVADAGIDAAASELLGLERPEPLLRLRLDRRKVVCFVPPEGLEAVRTALFGAGAGRIGLYAGCSFAAPGTATFTPLAGATPYSGAVGEPEQAPELRLEAVYPPWAEDDVVAALVRAHPYEEPAFDLLPLRNVAARRGRGRVGTRAGSPAAVWLGADGRLDARAARLGAARVDVPGDVAGDALELAGRRLSEATGLMLAPRGARLDGAAVLRVDGGSRGNPGPAAIGYRLETPSGALVEEAGEAIGVATNNVAEYRALLAGLAAARRHGATRVDVLADSELLVRQMTGTYKVRNDSLRPLWEQARTAVRDLDRVSFDAVPRALNAAADRLVNEALDRELR